MTLFNDYILVLPSIRAQSTLIHGTIGKSTHLRCLATVPFDTSVYWRRLDTNNISSQTSRFRQQQQIHGDLLHTTLYIKDLQKTDLGLYACFAESRGGRSKAVIELKEHHRSTTAHPTSVIFQISDEDEIITSTTTSRTLLLKRNKISDQTTIDIKTNHPSSSPSFIYSNSLIFLIILFYL